MRTRFRELPEETPAEERPSDPATTRDLSPAVPDLYERSFALVIGASEYREARWGNLPGVTQDVAAVAVALGEHGFAVTEVLDPDHEALEEALESFLLAESIRKRDRLLVYYAGHGYTGRSPQGVKTGYLVPVDAPAPDAGDFRRYALALDRIHQHSREAHADHALFLFDSCFSGEILERIRFRSAEPPPYVVSRARKPVRQFIASGQADEVVPDRSVFRLELVKALHGEADEDRDGYFTAFQLADYLSKKVCTKTAEAQHPQYGTSPEAGLNRGDFVFEVPPERRAERSRVPEPPAERPDFESLEQAADEIEPHHRNSRHRWEQRLEGMEEDFQKGLAFQERTIPTHYKIAFWRRFLEGYSDENPFASRDRELREQAALQIEQLEREEVEQPGPTGSEAAPGPGEVREETALKIRFRSVPPGRFRMGSPEDERARNADETPHAVHLIRGLWVAETAVTQGQWHAMMADDPSHFADCGDDCPVERVNWYDAVTFANRLSEHAGLEPCYRMEECSRSPHGLLRCARVVFLGLDRSGYRLPTEAEWEYAARAGTETPFWTGMDLSTDQANYDGSFPYRGEEHGRGEGRSVFRQRPLPVRSFEPNPWGLYEVHGNVAEWVWDAYGEYGSGEATDPLGAGDEPTVAQEDSRRVIRGGGWVDDAASCRAADRLPAAPGYRDSNVGFRLVRSFGLDPGNSD